jgi:heme oxygenase (biliverdin-IX-beta and delta-forming)
MRSPIMLRLKEETALYHAQLEANPRSQAMLSAAVTRDTYRSLLCDFYGFYRPLETQLEQVDWASLEFNYAARHKLPAMEADLRFLGLNAVDLLNIPECSDSPAITTLGQAVGTLYVLEGATLGGQIISRHLKAKLGLDAEHGASFFCSYGENVSLMWREYMSLATRYAESAHAEDEMIVAAIATFASFHDWLSSVSQVVRA